MCVWYSTTVISSNYNRFKRAQNQACLVPISGSSSKTISRKIWHLHGVQWAEEDTGFFFFVSDEIDTSDWLWVFTPPLFLRHLSVNPSWILDRMYFQPFFACPMETGYIYLKAQKAFFLEILEILKALWKSLETHQSRERARPHKTWVITLNDALLKNSLEWSLEKFCLYYNNWK